MAQEIHAKAGHSHSTHAHGSAKGQNFHNSNNSIKGLYTRIILISVIVSLIISGYRMVLAVLHDLRNEIFFGNDYKYIFAKGHENQAFSNLGPILLVLAGMALLVLLVDKIVPTNRGTGVGQIIAKLHDPKYKNKPRREIVAKFVSSAAGIFAGVAVGPESPACHMGGLVGEKVSDLSNADAKETEYLVASGAVAASASAFNLRLGALLFAQEELYQRFTRKTLVASLVAILVADFVNRLVMTPFYFLYGGTYKNVTTIQQAWETANKPVFDLTKLEWFKEFEILGFRDYIVATIGVILISILIAYIAFGLKKLTLFLYFKIKNWNRPLKLAVAFALVIPVALFLPEAISASYVFLKYTIVDDTVFANVEVWRLLVAAGALIIFTAYVQAIDFPGGIIVPFLAIGASLGLASGIIIGDAFKIASIEFRAVFMLAGMAAMLGAGGRTPLMAVALVLETTGAYIIFPAILLAGFMADLIEGLLPVSKPLAVVAAEEILGYHLEH